jgi:hypothetical protein
VGSIYEVTGVGPTLAGRNGEGDWYYTDGEVEISRLVVGCNTKVEATAILKNPPIIDLKNKTWKAMRDN